MRKGVDIVNLSTIEDDTITPLDPNPLPNFTTDQISLPNGISPTLPKLDRHVINDDMDDVD